MSHRTVRGVMTGDVATAGEDMPLWALAAEMTRRHVGALPVIDSRGRLAGLVSKADLRPDGEAREDLAARPLPWRRRYAGRARARGRTARHVMTSPVITIAADASLVEAARVMDRNHVKRLPVTGPDGRLAGIVSRGDLLKVFLRPDRDISEEIRHEVFAEYLWANPALVRVSVAEGVVTLAGRVEKKSMIPVATRMSRCVDGVVDVVCRLTCDTDDTGPLAPREVTYARPERARLEQAEYPRA